MSAAITLAGYFLIFGAWFALAFGLAVLFGRFLGLNDKLARGQMAPVMQERRDAEAAHRSAAMRSEWEAYLATLAEKRTRAEQRHANFKDAA